MHDPVAEARVDQALVVRALHGEDKRAFEQLVRRHQSRVRAQLRRLLPGEPGLADELAQETFLLAWRKLDQFRGEARFSTWLFRIAHSCFLQEHRKTKDEVCARDTVEEVRAVAPAPVALRLDLERAFRRLSPAEQSVLVHCAQLELSHEEAAYVLGMPLGTVKTHALRGKAKLKEWLADWRDENAA